MAITKAIDLVNPEVMADAVGVSLEKGIRFAPFAKVDDTLVGEPGDTITRPKYGYVGPAEDLVEGVAMDPKKLSMTTSKVTVKEVGTSVEPTEKSIITNVDGTLGEVANQLGLSVADKIDIDYISAMSKTLLNFKGDVTTAANIIDATVLFNDEDEEDYVLFINPKDYAELRKEMIVGNTFLSKAQIAELLGLFDLVTTKRVEVGTAYIQKVGAVEIVYKKTPEIKVAEDILKRTLVFAINSHYATNLYSDNGVVKITAPDIEG